MSGRPRIGAAALILVALLVLLGSAGPASAQTTTVPVARTGVGGVQKADGDPVPGVRVTVTDDAGTPRGGAVSDAEGRWFVPLPAAGRYDLTLDPATLPAGVRLTDPDRRVLADVQIQGGRTRNVLFGLTRGSAATTAPGGSDTATAPSSDGGDGGGGGGGPSLVDRLTRRLVSGVLFGLIIAMTAIGLSLIFGTTGLVNFAHGELVTFGAIVAWFLNVEGPRVPLVMAGLLAVVAGALAGASLEGGLWGPLRARRTGQFQLLVISIGVSIAARQALLIWFGSGARRYRQYAVQKEPWDLGPISVAPRDAIIMMISVVTLVLVALLLNRTRIGKAMRAVADNPDLAASSGIDVRRVILFVWIMGGALAAGGGVLQGTATSVEYLRGFQLLLLMFAGVILGGLGTAYGAMIGSLAVGLTTELSTLVIPAELKTVSALAVLIVVLLIRPQGLLGSRERVG